MKHKLAYCISSIYEVAGKSKRFLTVAITDFSQRQVVIKDSIKIRHGQCRTNLCRIFANLQQLTEIIAYDCIQIISHYKAEKSN